MEKQIIARIAVMMVVTLVIASILVVFITIQEQEETPTVVKYDIYVDDDGTADYTSIQEAIDNASDGDNIYVYSGIYYENVLIDKSIELIGENANTTVIDGNGNVIEVTYGRVNLNGFKLQNGDYGILYLSSNNIAISNNTVTDNKFHGIYIWNASNISIIDNCIKNNTHDGLIILYSSYCNISKNNIVNNGKVGIKLANTSYSNIYKNTCTQNFWEGIQLHDSSAYNIIYRNNIIENSHGIGLVGDHGPCVYNNLIYHNNFINNIYTTAYDHCFNDWDNGYPSGGNYWDDYNGTDGDGDGIGDTAYDVLKRYNQTIYKNVDRYPLMNPVDI